MNILSWIDNGLRDVIREVFLELFGGVILGAPTRWVSDGIYLLAKVLSAGVTGATVALKAPGWISNTSKVKERLIQAFIQSEIYLESHRRDWGDGQTKTLRTFPAIERVTVNDAGTIVTLRLPVGMDPTLIEDKAWVFQNVFGATAHLLNDKGGWFRLAIPKSLPTEIPYNFEKARAVIEMTGGFAFYVGESNDGSVAFDLVKKPHVGVIGVTGWGKSSGLRCALNTWLQCYDPNHLRLFLGDLKMTEFGSYKGVPHVEGTIAVRRKEVVAMLSEVHEVLLYRQQQFYEVGATDLNEYVEMTGERMPYVVVCIDEVASLEGEAAAHDVLEEIGQMGRSFGIFLIASQQRIDSEIMDGKLKNNLNVRIAYRTSDEMNSRMFLGTSVASEINTPGRCYVKDTNSTKEVQTPWLSPKESREQIEAVKQRYNQFKKMPLIPPVNSHVPQPVELNDEESADLRELLGVLMQSEGETKHARTR
ncbi:FtsK/SpoIIIE domain-containing protein [Brevibacillus choshinensis]|uniref:FtsK/SpoIIIE domain-containing protein n=1 Tax=Brevibacillus choshinensis TaxID=54911 RepID=UPI002E21EEEF|nr:FtsK/SpoIIIE domain-containing protein [Brevibacillus choshinensis]MED4586686.1 FtsK/SpoIIIE domain-containing protein [Brevibacillus choshinensis]